MTYLKVSKDQITKTTNKALLLSLFSGMSGKERFVWLPKSKVKVLEMKGIETKTIGVYWLILSIPEWLIRENNISGTESTIPEDLGYDYTWINL